MNQSFAGGVDSPPRGLPVAAVPGAEEAPRLLPDDARLEIDHPALNAELDAWAASVPSCLCCC